MRLAARVFALAVAFPATAFAGPSGKYFDRFILVVLENTDKATALNDPFFQALSTFSFNLNNYWAVTHPSQPNYFALASQNTFVPELSLTYANGDKVYDIPSNYSHIGDALEASDISWKIYLEAYPGNCFVDAKAGSAIISVSTANGTTFNVTEDNNLYARKHNPFISFANINTNATRCNAHVGNETDFLKDLAGGTLPQYVFFVPNQWNDGHDFYKAVAGNITSPTQVQGPYLQSLLPLLGNYSDQYSNRTLVQITFDENDVADGPALNAAKCPDPTNNCTIDNNIVFSILSGPVINDLGLAGTTTNVPLNHHSVVASLVDNWGLNWTTPDLHGLEATAFPLNRIKAGPNLIIVPALPSPTALLPLPAAAPVTTSTVVGGGGGASSMRAGVLVAFSVAVMTVSLL